MDFDPSDEDELIDSILLEPIETPVVTANGSIYDLRSISEWLQRNDSDVLLQEKLIQKQLLKVTLDDCQTIGKKDMRTVTRNYWNEYVKAIQIPAASLNKLSVYRPGYPSINQTFQGYDFSEFELFDVIFVECTFDKCSFGDLTQVVFIDCQFYGNCDFGAVQECTFCQCTVGSLTTAFQFWVWVQTTGELNDCNFEEKSGVTFNSSEINTAACQHTFYLSKVEFALETGNSDYLSRLFEDTSVLHCSDLLILGEKLSQLSVEHQRQLLLTQTYTQILQSPHFQLASGFEGTDPLTEFNVEKSILFLAVIQEQFNLALSLVEHQPNPVDVAYSCLSLVEKQRLDFLAKFLRQFRLYYPEQEETLHKTFTLLCQEHLGYVATLGGFL